MNLALTRSPADLRTAALAGSAVEQFALSLTYDAGLNGQGRDPQAAAYWRNEATRRPASTFVTSYTPGSNGGPGRVAVIPVPGDGYPLENAAAIDECLQVLQAPQWQVSDRRACGGTRSLDLLRARWLQALGVHERVNDP
ncbi:MAG: hypothetical protein IM669_10250 [Phenylobacterium sp.]|uniref:hypothetical protein n=1 Tax=Phenylobacterium sp. TaxID=1871053 RepID=UPI00217937B0|nr:hypothetical protein [Phenylobacterium sp.]MCA3260097.1 hypothetical protein [Rubrivivax sp.]MCA3757888.1 hypothetical protein [Phenylobacterium sp.]